ncbi:MAG: aldo/keto reductase [Micropepsaceae bacterium]
MRTVDCPGVGAVSALGFGCASLGSRISEKAGRAAIDAALQSGITWFDVAPSYGDGKAEQILGAALKGTNAHIVTKAGLIAGRRNPVKAVIGAAARPIVAAIPALRPLVKKLRPDNARRLPLDAETLRVSLLQSLERLGRTDLAVFALHEPTLDDVRNEAVIRALDDIKSEGLAARIAIAGAPEIFAAAREAGLPADTLQTANSPFVKGLAAAPADTFTITHSVFGVAGALDKLKRLPESTLRAAGFPTAADALLTYAFAANPDGVVLTSAYAPAHLAANTEAASTAPDPTAISRLEALL